MQYPGRDRLEGIRTRLSDMRRDTGLALERTEALRADLDALRKEVGNLTATIGTQIAALSEALERLERELEKRASDSPQK
jgi:hypothetical protein